MADDIRPTEELLSAPIPKLITGLGMAIVEAQKAMSAIPNGPDYEFVIPEATVEVNVAISVNKSSDLTVGGGLTLSAFTVNASYKSTYGFKEEASSKIIVKFMAKPKAAPATP